uniref:CX domain-containing protein n=1 Tax=Globodera pallida TaxID=36090 RepID=A0A183C652_GLOPA
MSIGLLCSILNTIFSRVIMPLLNLDAFTIEYFVLPISLSLQSMAYGSTTPVLYFCNDQYRSAFRTPCSNSPKWKPPILELSPYTTDNNKYSPNPVVQPPAYSTAPQYQQQQQQQLYRNNYPSYSTQPPEHCYGCSSGGGSYGENGGYSGNGAGGNYGGNGGYGSGGNYGGNGRYGGGYGTGGGNGGYGGGGGYGTGGGYGGNGGYGGGGGYGTGGGYGGNGGYEEIISPKFFRIIPRPPVLELSPYTTDNNKYSPNPVVQPPAYSTAPQYQQQQQQQQQQLYRNNYPSYSTQPPEHCYGCSSGGGSYGENGGYSGNGAGGNYGGNGGYGSGGNYGGNGRYGGGYSTGGGNGGYGGGGGYGTGGGYGGNGGYSNGQAFMPMPSYMGGMGNLFNLGTGWGFNLGMPFIGTGVGVGTGLGVSVGR